MAILNLDDAVDYHYGQFPPGSIDLPRLIDPLLQAQGALARYDQLLESMHNSEILLAPLRQQEAVVSSRMEGTISTLDEVLRLDAEDMTDTSDDAFRNARSETIETLLYSRALKHAERAMSEGYPLSEHLIKTAHQMLLSFGRGATMLPGQYKIEQNYIGARGQRSVSFIPISPNQLPAGMHSLMSFIQDDAMTPLIKTALAHVEFEALHPFKDGNGRVGRMLITLMLWKHGLIRAPHFYVSAFFEENRDAYIDAMRNVSAEHAWTEWCIFFLTGLRTQAERNAETARQVFALYQDMKDRFREALNSQWTGSAVDFVFTNPIFKTSKMIAETDMPPHVVRRMTRILHDNGLLVELMPAAGRRPALYAFEPLLEVVRNA